MWGNHTSFVCALHDTCGTGIRKTASTIGQPAELIKSVRYVTLGLINIEGLEETPKTVLLDIGELFLRLFFQTLAPITLKQYLPEETIRQNSIGLNRKDPLHQGLRVSLNQGPDAAWATYIDESVRALHTQHMESIHWMPYILAARKNSNTYVSARDPVLALGDDPSILTQCVRCKKKR